MKTVLHILVTCSPYVNSAGSRLPYMVFVVAKVIDPVKDNLSCQTGSAMNLNRLGCSVVPFVSRQMD